MPEVDVSMTAEHGGHRVIFEIDGRQLETPPVEHLAFYVGLGVLVATHVVPAPVAVAVGVGHVVLEMTRRPGLQELGRALEEA
jgi:hypothetical protein